MLAQTELEQTAAQLADFQATHEKDHAALSGVLQSYTALIAEYKRLQSEYEEARDSRDRYKQLAKGQERSPFVLVLIDGHGYGFEDDLVSNGKEGGQKAAELLNNAVKSSLRGRGLEHCRIMVRMYANLANLSKSLSKSKLAGPEKRSLAPFTASFNRSNGLFDFIDAGELESADFKIKAMFRQFVESSQCRHIYFAGCHDASYLTELTPHVGDRDRITLIRSPVFHPEFSKLGMRVEEFPNLFRAIPLEDQSSSKPTAAKVVKHATKSVPDIPPTSTTCSFFQKGICKNGNECRFTHVNANGDSKKGLALGSLSEIRDWRQNASGGNSKLPFQMPPAVRSTKSSMGWNGTSRASTQSQADVASMLPQADSIPHNEIPVNRYQYRIDAYIPPPSSEDRAAFAARTSHQKLCNNHHILNNCPHTDDCEYDHDQVSVAVLNCLREVNLNNPCPRKGDCRKLTCLNGHICQKAECKFRGGKVFCKLSPVSHSQELQVTQYVPGTGRRNESASSDWVTETSSKASTPTIPKARGWIDESDGENGQYEGALLDFDDDATTGWQ